MVGCGQLAQGGERVLGLLAAQPISDERFVERLTEQREQRHRLRAEGRCSPMLEADDAIGQNDFPPNDPEHQRANRDDIHGIGHDMPGDLDEELAQHPMPSAA